MNALRALYHLMRADLFERARRYSFWITLGLTLFVAYLYIPTKEANYLTLGLGNYRGTYNSAWMGGAMAVLCSALLSLPAFYLVKNAIERDERTKVGQIIATTPLSKALYTLGKAFSNWAFLALLVGGVALAAVAMQWIRSEVLRIDLWPLLSPFLLCVLPAMALIAAVAILFESISWLRGTFGNVLYFIIWLGSLIATAATLPNDPRQIGEPTNDLGGVVLIVSSMMKDTAAAFPGYHGGATIGSGTLTAPVQTFTWPGIHWSMALILGRLAWLGLAIGISLAAALFFHRFDPARERPRRGRRGMPAEQAEADREPVAAPTPPAVPIRLSPLAWRPRSRWAALLVAELRMALKGMRWWWFVVAFALIVAGVLAPLGMARQWLLPVAWLWPLAIWSSMGCREARHGTGQLVFSAPRVLRRQLPMSWLAGVLVTMATGSGVAIHMALSSDGMGLLTWATAALFIPALALTLGAWSGSSRLFEVVYVIAWYAGPINGVPFLDFMGASAQGDIGRLGIYWAGTALLLGLAVVGRAVTRDR